MKRSRSEVQEGRRFVDPFGPAARTVGFADQARPDHAAIVSDASQEGTAPPPPSRYELRHRKTSVIKASHKIRATEHLATLPEPSCSVHLITSGNFDFWDYLAAILNQKAPAVCERFLGSTWVLNRQNAHELLQLFDAGRIRRIGLITGTYFKRRESAVFHLIYEGLKARGQRFKAINNHSKWVAMRFDDGTAYVAETSANFTENGNAEQVCLTSDPGLFDFYQEWADAVFEDRR